MAIVGLIPCVSTKREVSTVARNLYSSSLFIKAREYVERQCDFWYILSAKHGLVSPDQVIAPYEETLNSKPRVEREQWARMVWTQLEHRLKRDDHVIVLAGARYRELLIPRILEHGCLVDTPMNGLGIGQQLKWLTKRSEQSKREQALDRVYRSLRSLELAFGEKRLLSHANGQQTWPKSGLYFFFEPSEYRADEKQLRIVRVGTHGVSSGSKATLWGRLRTHRGTTWGLGNHRSSIFRLHVGAALAARTPSLFVSSWGQGQIAKPEIRSREEQLERAVSKYIGMMSVLWLAVEDVAGPASDRAYLERNLIGLLGSRFAPTDLPSPDWLGNFSPNERIRNSGLWNLNFLEHPYTDDFLDVLDEYVLATLGRKPSPSRPIAPPNWNTKRLGASVDQLVLFQEAGDG